MFNSLICNNIFQIYFILPSLFWSNFISHIMSSINVSAYNFLKIILFNQVTTSSSRIATNNSLILQHVQCKSSVTNFACVISFRKISNFYMLCGLLFGSGPKWDSNSANVFCINYLQIAPLTFFLLHHLWEQLYYLSRQVSTVRILVIISVFSNVLKSLLSVLIIDLEILILVKSKFFDKTAFRSCMIFIPSEHLLFGYLFYHARTCLQSWFVNPLGAAKWCCLQLY